MEKTYKEVLFDIYCKTCKYYESLEEYDPCLSCLNEPKNLYSHKPINYKEAK